MALFPWNSIKCKINCIKIIYIINKAVFNVLKLYKIINIILISLEKRNASNVMINLQTIFFAFIQFCIFYFFSFIIGGFFLITGLLLKAFLLYSWFRNIPDVLISVFKWFCFGHLFQFLEMFLLLSFSLVLLFS